jgi:hypothetical protein
MTDKEARPWDFLDPRTEYVSQEVSSSRYSICLECEFFTNTLPRLCSKCHCVMKIKCKISHASCPEGKW